jgi:hypothetical protein
MQIGGFSSIGLSGVVPHSSAVRVSRSRPAGKGRVIDGHRDGLQVGGPDSTPREQEPAGEQETIASHERHGRILLYFAGT